MRITGGNVFSGGAFAEADLVIDGDRIAGVVSHGADLDGAASPDGVVVDASGCYVVPGFVDIHFHGCVGADLCDATDEAVRSIARHEASRGVTAVCPATMTYPEERLASVVDAAAAFEPAADEAALVGINMEGPFISPDKIGAQNPAYVQRADAAMLTLQGASPAVRKASLCGSAIGDSPSDDVLTIRAQQAVPPQRAPRESAPQQRRQARRARATQA